MPTHAEMHPGMFSHEAPREDEVVDGLVYLNFEQCDFRPLVQDEVWWIAGGLDLLVKFTSLTANVPPTQRRLAVFGRVVADVSPAGRFGHMGRYSREIVIKAVLELRQSTEDERGMRKEVQ